MISSISYGSHGHTHVAAGSIDRMADVIFKISPSEWHHLVDDPWDFATEVAEMLHHAMPGLKQYYPNSTDFSRQCENFCIRELSVGHTWSINGTPYNARVRRSVVRDWLESQGIEAPKDSRSLALTEDEHFAFKMRFG